MNNKQLGKKLRQILDPIVERKNLDYNTKNSYCKNIKSLADTLTIELDAELEPLVSELRLSYQWHQVNGVLDAIDKYKNKGFRIIDFKVATSEEDGFYLLKRKLINYEINSQKSKKTLSEN